MFVLSRVIAVKPYTLDSGLASYKINAYNAYAESNTKLNKYKEDFASFK
jgi:hypothetical protein